MKDRSQVALLCTLFFAVLKYLLSANAIQYILISSCERCSDLISHSIIGSVGYYKGDTSVNPYFPAFALTRQHYVFLHKL